MLYQYENYAMYRQVILQNRFKELFGNVSKEVV